MGSYTTAGVDGPDLGLGIVGTADGLSVCRINMTGAFENHGAMIIMNEVNELDDVIELHTH